ncbi:unnamed protein product [Ectocarpus sp. CCAP 1310/34]|nr:unnamed protein product [Ectocarpus sp. CCAP 1310/34]
MERGRQLSCRYVQRVGCRLSGVGATAGGGGAGTLRRLHLYTEALFRNGLT